MRRQSVLAAIGLALAISCDTAEVHSVAAPPPTLVPAPPPAPAPVAPRPDAGAPPPGGCIACTDGQPGGTLQWLRILSTPADDGVISVDASPEGDLYAAIESHGLRWARYDSHGNPVWSQPDAAQLFGVAAPRGPARLLFGWGFQKGEGPGGMAELVSLSPDGTGRQVLRSACSDCSLGPLVTNAWGDRAFVDTSRRYSSVEFNGADGSHWRVDDLSVPVNFRQVALAPNGDVVLAGTAERSFSLGAQVLGEDDHPTPVVLRYARDGRLLWAQHLPGARGFVSGLGVSALGTVVVSGSFAGTATWGEQTLPGSGEDKPAGFLLTVEADGQPRWARQLDPDHADMKLAVDPSGQAVLVGGRSPCNGSFVTRYNLAGEFLWERVLAPEDCAGMAAARSVTIAGHQVVVGGTFHGRVNFGSGPKISRGDDGFLLDLSP